MVQIRQQLIPWSWEPKFLYSQFVVHDWPSVTKATSPPKTASRALAVTACVRLSTAKTESSQYKLKGRKISRACSSRGFRLCSRFCG